MKNCKEQMEKRNGKCVGRGVKKCCMMLCHIVLGVVVVALAAWGAMALWNWLIPDLTGWNTLGYPQTLGLFALCRLFFGRLPHKGCCHGHVRNYHEFRVHKKWDGMTPAQREAFMKNHGIFASCCGNEAKDSHNDDERGGNEHQK